MKTLLIAACLLCLHATNHQAQASTATKLRRNSIVDITVKDDVRPMHQRGTEGNDFLGMKEEEMRHLDRILQDAQMSMKGSTSSSSKFAKAAAKSAKTPKSAKSSK
eukprot:CAMPEP_0198114270 /NCGR_PEP_ID=MMETSP1442-20131203/5699_1 /TAXON_ID= /ORGANISM="Craspedostauros australis, Strain CCMP3328" /LENGTH=105 /DNA_ID=CAMNT_0043771543 /DNA_START=323 /DNA_END=640 /DNA_ORIENTATION=+